MPHYTGVRDHRGVPIRSGDRCILDGGHGDDFWGWVIQKLDGSFWFEHESNGDKVELEKVADELEVLV